MTTTSKILGTTAAILLGSGMLLAQNASASSPNSDPNIYQRRQNQQDRVANGVQNGSLTAGETRNLENREANVNRETAQDRAADGGKLTQQDRQQIQHQDNNISHSIYQDKHNAANAHYGNNEVGQRRENQQDRIAQGIRSGQMTPSEAARSEHQEQNINRSTAADRQANGGRLTSQERQNINRRQNNASRNIYNRKHNGAHRF